jgi:hypothetical protein
MHKTIPAHDRIRNRQGVPHQIEALEAPAGRSKRRIIGFDQRRYDVGTDIGHPRQVDRTHPVEIATRYVQQRSCPQ